MEESTEISLKTDEEILQRTERNSKEFLPPDFVNMVFLNVLNYEQFLFYVTLIKPVIAVELMSMTHPQEHLSEAAAKNFN